MTDTNLIKPKHKRLTKKQKRMRDAVAYLMNYMNTYDRQAGYMDYADGIFIDDVLYGLGVALGGDKYKMANGYIEFKKVLVEHLRRTNREDIGLDKVKVS